MDSEKKPVKHIQIAALIYASWMDDRDPNSEFNRNMREVSKRGRAIGTAARKRRDQEKERYYETVRSWANKGGSRLSELLPLDIYNPLISPKLEHASHPLRQAEERYLLINLGIENTGNVLENWALIGMALSAAGEDSPIGIVLPKPTEKRGRRKSGLSVDYQRAVWKHLLEEWEVTLSTPEGKDFTYSGSGLFTLNELLDVFLSELDDPYFKDSQEAFQEIESRLKLKGVSRDTLTTSFSRGDKERREMWES